jgi:hypothetical protein
VKARCLVLACCKTPCTETGDSLECSGGEEGIFYWQNGGKKTNYISSFHAAAVDLWRGGGSRRHGNKFSGAKHHFCATGFFLILDIHK